ncbi:hypothetical protein [Sinomonas sp. P47F7]|uniref:hypothetical protein n=1 Tax=Sinomonas sp. P47F7 TaxID=3410987 RepID=UPI003BF6049B
MRILHLLREYGEARNATPARTIYQIAASAVLVTLLLGTIFAGVPIWLFWTVVALEAAVDVILVRRWMIRDAAARAASDER